MIAVIEKMIKQRRDSIAQFEKAARQDLADKEKFEIGVLDGYLPQQLSRGRDRRKSIAAAIAATGASGVAGHGQGDGASLKPQLAGRADMGKVSALVRRSSSG